MGKKGGGAKALTSGKGEAGGGGGAVRWLAILLAVASVGGAVYFGRGAGSIVVRPAASGDDDVIFTNALADGSYPDVTGKVSSKGRFQNTRRKKKRK
jgi:3-oxoacyl-[acyl-carrier-protein] synthase III